MNEGAVDMSKFIYVFSTHERDDLLEKGFMLLSSDDRNDVYIFASIPEMNFSLSDIAYVESDTLVI